MKNKSDSKDHARLYKWSQLVNILHKKPLIQLYFFNSVIKLIIAIHLYISNYPMPNMWYIILEHIVVTIAGVIIPYLSEPSTSIIQLLRCWYQPSFSLSGRDGDSNQFQLAGNLFLTQTQVYQPRQPQVTFGTTQVHISWVHTALHNQGLTVARSLKPCLPTVPDQVVQVMLAHSLLIHSPHNLTTIQSAHSNRIGPSLS